MTSRHLGERPGTSEEKSVSGGEVRVTKKRGNALNLIESTS